MAALIVGEPAREVSAGVPGLGEHLDRVGDLFDLPVFELLAGLEDGQGGVGDQREHLRRVAGRRRFGRRAG